MTTIWERTKTALTTLGLPLAADIYVAASGGDLPDTYLTYMLISNPPEQHADDAETMQSYLVQVTCFCRNGLNSLPDINTAMISAGFMRGPAREIPFSTETRHYGLAMDFIYME